MEELVGYRIYNRSLTIEIVFDYYRFYQEIRMATVLGEILHFVDRASCNDSW